MNNLYYLLLWQPQEPKGNAGYLNLLLLVGAMVIIYFMMIRPQAQQRKKQTSFAQSLKKGKKVVTIGGIHGVIADISDNTMELIIAPKTHITVQRDAISMDFTVAAYGSQSESTSNTADSKQEESK